MSQAQFVAAVQEGLDDLEAGRVLGDDELGRRLDARFGPVTEPSRWTSRRQPVPGSIGALDPDAAE